jgi:alpha-L-fucosidase 2
MPMLNPSTDVLFAEPAESFTESCPIGNGRIGGMVFGGVDHERVVLNESTLWSGSPQDADREDAYKVLPEIRRLLLNNENKKAQELLQENFICKGPGSGSGNSKDGPYGCYQMFADLHIDQKHPAGERQRYSRHLDLSKAIAHVSYDQGGVHFTREAFVSHPDQVLVYRYAADKPKAVNLNISLSRAENATVTDNGTDLIIAGQLSSGNPKIPGVRYEGRVRVVTDGTCFVGRGAIQVADASYAMILFSGGTNLKDPHYQEHLAQHLFNASATPFAEMRRRHVKDYQKFFNRVKLDLPEGTSAALPTSERLKAATTSEDDPSLATLYFNFGRYLLISSSRPDSPLPANLQGIWAEELQTPWNADFHLDINVQMNYWLAEITGLGDCHQPLLKFIPQLVPNGSKTAKAYYGARGWVAHVITNPWLFTSPGEGADWGSTVSGSGWLCEHLWNHYAYTKDKAFLAQIYPVLKGASLFFQDMLIAEPKHGWLVTAPSNSPENQYVHPVDGPLSTCMGPTIDESIIRELFTNTIAASKVLRQDAEFAASLQATREKLAPFQVGKHGQIQEWLEDYDETDVHHRHTSPLYGLYPATQISPRDTPELAAAARRTLERRGDGGTGWSLAWKVCFWARLEDGDHAWLLLKRLFHPVGVKGFNYGDGGGTYGNLFDAHPPFQIDGNFGASAGIAEMLVQAHGTEIRLLPALPKAWSSQGFVTGLRVPGNLSVDIQWKDGKVVSYKLRGANAKKYTVVSS